MNKQQRLPEWPVLHEAMHPPSSCIPCLAAGATTIAQWRWQRVATLATAKQGSSRKHNRSDGRGDRQYDDEQPYMQAQLSGTHREMDDRSQRDDPCAKCRRQRRRMHTREKIGQTMQAKRSGQYDQATAKQQQRN